MDFNIKEIKKTAKKQLEGKWNNVVLALFVSFVAGIFINFLPETKEAFSNEDFLSSLFGRMVFLFFSSLISYSFSVGIYNLILSRNEKKKKLGFFAIILVSFASLRKAILPVFVLKFLHLMADGFLSPENGLVFYDILFYSYFEIPVYLIITQILRVVLNLFFFWFGIIYIFTPCILAEVPFIPASSAMKLSARLTRGMRGKLVLLVISFIGWMMLGALAFFIGTFFAMAYEMAAICVVYKKIRPGIALSIERKND